MTRPYSLAFKQKMIERLTGKEAVSAVQLARETGIRQQNLSRWLQEARSLPHVATSRQSGPKWSVEQKAQLVAEVSKLSGEQLSAYLAEHGVKLAEFEHWRAALQDDNHASTTAGKRIRQLERELARKEKALAEASALLMLKKEFRASIQTRTTTRTGRARGNPGRLASAWRQRVGWWASRPGRSSAGERDHTVMPFGAGHTAGPETLSPRRKRRRS